VFLIDHLNYANSSRDLLRQLIWCDSLRWIFGGVRRSPHLDELLEEESPYLISHSAHLWLGYAGTF
jgi:hypothetical protein